MSEVVVIGGIEGFFNISVVRSSDQQYNRTLAVDPALTSRFNAFPLTGNTTESVTDDIVTTLDRIAQPPPGDLFRVVDVPEDAGIAIYLVLSDTLLNSNIYQPPSQVTSQLPQLAGKYQTYLLYSAPDTGLWIVSAGWRGVMHGAYDFLGRSGAKWPLPSEIFTAISPRSSIRMTVNEIVSPVFDTIQMSPTGGCITNAWTDPSLWNHQQDDLYRNMRRNRRVIGHGHCNAAAITIPEHQAFGGHSLPSYLSELRPDLQDDPLNFAFINGIREDPLTSFNTNQTYNGSVDGIEDPLDYTTYGGLIKAIGDHVKRSCEFAVANMDPTIVPTFSVDNNDGQALCECDKCVNLLRNGPYGFGPGAPDSTGSDRVFHFGRQIAIFIINHFPWFLLNSYAYYNYVAIPSVPIPAGYLVIAILEVFSDAKLPDIRLRAWAQKRLQELFKMGIYNYTGLFSGLGANDARNDPGVFFRTGLTWPENDVRSVVWETSASTGATGMQYHFLFKLAWDAAVNPTEMLSEMWESLFPDPAIRALVRAASDRYSSWNAPIGSGYHRYHEGPFEFGESFADLKEAGVLAVTFGETVQLRVAAFQAYAWYLLLLYLFRISEGTQQAREAILEVMFQHVYRTFFTGMTHSFAVEKNFIQDGFISEEFKDKWNTNLPLVGGQDWETRTGVHPPTDEELISEMQAHMVTGTVDYPKFALTPRPVLQDEFDLVPVGPDSLDATVVTDNFTAAVETPGLYTFGSAHYAFLFSGPGGFVDIKSLISQPVLADIRFILSKPDGTTEIFVDELVWQDEEPVISSRVFSEDQLGQGLFRLRVDSVSSVAVHRAETPNNLRFTRIGLFYRPIQTVGEPNYFWVPESVESFAVFIEDPIHLELTPEFRADDVLQPATEIFNPNNTSGRTWIVQVAPGTSGAWSVNNITAQWRLINLWQGVARSKEKLLVPRELTT